jgi:hypothetical protein
MAKNVIYYHNVPAVVAKARKSVLKCYTFLKTYLMLFVLTFKQILSKIFLFPKVSNS